MTMIPKIHWRRADRPKMPHGLITPAGDGTILRFNCEGHLIAYSLNGELNVPPMRLARREDVGDEMHLVFEYVPRPKTGDI
jgi:hypothetical protein